MSDRLVEAGLWRYGPNDRFEIYELCDGDLYLVLDRALIDRWFSDPDCPHRPNCGHDPYDHVVTLERSRKAARRAARRYLRDAEVTLMNARPLVRIP